MFVKLCKRTYIEFCHDVLEITVRVCAGRRRRRCLLSGSWLRWWKHSRLLNSGCLVTYWWVCAAAAVQHSDLFAATTGGTCVGRLWEQAGRCRLRSGCRQAGGHLACLRRHDPLLVVAVNHRMLLLLMMMMLLLLLLLTWQWSQSSINILLLNLRAPTEQHIAIIILNYRKHSGGKTVDWLLIDFHQCLLLQPTSLRGWHQWSLLVQRSGLIWWRQATTTSIINMVLANMRTQRLRWCCRLSAPQIRVNLRTIEWWCLNALCSKALALTSSANVLIHILFECIFTLALVVIIMWIQFSSCFHIHVWPSSLTGWHNKKWGGRTNFCTEISYSSTFKTLLIPILDNPIHVAFQ